MRVFVAGASGALGRQLVPELVATGHEVVGMTRTAAKQEALRGWRPVSGGKAVGRGLPLTASYAAGGDKLVDHLLES